MPSFDILIAFAAATFVFAVYPGPALLYTAAQTLARGRRSGFLAALGIHCGCYLHVVAATLGLSAVFQHVPALYVALKLVGAAYLVFIGIGMIREQGATGEIAVAACKSPARAFLESMLVEILNPKVAIFFVAFLPQFVDPWAAYPIWLQFLILGIVVNCAFSTADIVTVMLASTVVTRLRRMGTAERVVRIVGGSLIAGLGLRLALDRS
ncbi:MAG: LysE family translocator [Hyphomicrobiales bacterium]